MPVKRFVTNTLKLEEPVIRLADLLAERYGVTIQELIEALLLYCAELEQDAGAGWGPSLEPDLLVTTPRPVEPRWSRGPGNLIVLGGDRTCGQDS